MPRVFEALDRNAQSQAQLIADVLDVSRIVTGKLQLQLTTVDVCDLVLQATDSVRAAAAAKDTTLTVEEIPNCLVRGDAGRRQQVVWNLLSNAIKFPPTGGSIRVRVTRHATIAMYRSLSPTPAPAFPRRSCHPCSIGFGRRTRRVPAYTAGSASACPSSSISSNSTAARSRPPVGGVSGSPSCASLATRSPTGLINVLNRPVACKGRCERQRTPAPQSSRGALLPEPAALRWHLPIRR